MCVVVLCTESFTLVPLSNKRRTLSHPPVRAPFPEPVFAAFSVINSEIGYLGYQAPESYGLTYKVRETYTRNSVSLAYCNE